MFVFDGNYNQSLESLIANNASFPNAGLNVLRVRVKADDENWGSVYSKVVGINITYNTTVTLISPANTALNVPTNSNFVWNTLTGAGSYEYQCSTDTTFITLTQTAIISGTSVPFSGLAINTVYYWRVRVNVNGNVSLWSDVWSFTTDNVLGTIDFDSTKIIVYPNPASTVLYINSTIVTDEFTYTIFSMDGKEILSGKTHKNQQIDIGQLASGTYILNLIDHNGFSKKFKVLKT